MSGEENQSESERPRSGHAYHHGDLHNALMAAAEAELGEKGIEGFTLRGCAKRAGVSHAAPAHHFRDANGLLTALAETGFRRFVAMQLDRQSKAPADARSQLAAAGVGYVQFALDNPELFKLMFSSQRTDFDNAGLRAAASAAFDHLVDGVAAIRGRDPRDDEAAMTDVRAAWAIVHGIASLLIARQLKSLSEMAAEDRDRVIEEMIRRATP